MITFKGSRLCANQGIIDAGSDKDLIKILEDNRNWEKIKEKEAVKVQAPDYVPPEKNLFGKVKKDKKKNK